MLIIIGKHPLNINSQIAKTSILSYKFATRAKFY